MAKRHFAVAVLCLAIVSVFIYSFWVGAKSDPKAAALVSQTAAVD